MGKPETLDAVLELSTCTPLCKPSVAVAARKRVRAGSVPGTCTPCVIASHGSQPAIGCLKSTHEKH